MRLHRCDKFAGLIGLTATALDPNELEDRLPEIRNSAHLHSSVPAKSALMVRRLSKAVGSSPEYHD